MNAKARKICIFVISASVIGGLVALMAYYGMKKPEKPAEDKPSTSRVEVPPLEFDIQQGEGGESVENKPEVPETSEIQEVTGQIEEPQEENVQETRTPEPSELSGNELWKQLASGDYAGRFVMFLDEITMGYMPAKSLGEHKSEVKFTAREENGEWFLTDASAKRYSPFVELFCSIDPQAAAKFYTAMKPAFQKAVNALGYTDRSIDKMLLGALEAARGIPLYESEPPMIRLNDNLFTWKYEEIEKLTPAQKCVMRMGQGNVRKIREQIERLAAEAGLE